jgi:hypothetical protein
LLVLFVAVLSATVVHADEPDAVGVEEAVSETGEPADPVTSKACWGLTIPRPW